jgi:hypothetical protein
MSVNDRSRRWGLRTGPKCDPVSWTLLAGCAGPAPSPGPRPGETWRTRAVSGGFQEVVAPPAREGRGRQPAEKWRRVWRRLSWKRRPRMRWPPARTASARAALDGGGSGSDRRGPRRGEADSKPADRGRGPGFSGAGRESRAPTGSRAALYNPGPPKVATLRGSPRSDDFAHPGRGPPAVWRLSPRALSPQAVGHGAVGTFVGSGRQRSHHAGTAPYVSVPFPAARGAMAASPS